MSDLDIDPRRAAALEDILLKRRGHGIRYELLTPEPPIVAPVVQKMPCPLCGEPMPTKDLPGLIERCQRCKDKKRVAGWRAMKRAKRAKKAETR